MVPPGTGICHQVNCEYLAQVVWSAKDGQDEVAYPDTLVGTDSHTTMVNGLAVLGWGVGGIEAEAAMLGQPISMLIPEVIGFKLTGAAEEGVTATDLVLTVTQMLRKKGVVGKFVEFYGPGVGRTGARRPRDHRQHGARIRRDLRLLPDRRRDAALSDLTGRDAARVKLVEAYAKAQGMWRDDATPDPVFTDTIELDLGTVEPSLAGPRRPQDRVALAKAKQGFADALPTITRRRDGRQEIRLSRRARRDRQWRCGDRRDHVLHQHLESVRHAGRRPGGAEGGRPRG